MLTDCGLSDTATPVPRARGTLGGMTTFIVERAEDGSISHRQEADPQAWLGEGELTINVSHSSLNYKDAMALAGDKGVMRISPLVPGIDAVGTTEDGTLVTCNGAGLGEFRHGGYTSLQRVPAEATVEVPQCFSAEQAAAIGTAGYTAALCVNALLDHGLPPAEEAAPVLVTGATGGVGSIAVNLLSNLGYKVTALTGRQDELGEYLSALGAQDVLDRSAFMDPGKPLQKARFAGAVDTLGGTPLANVLSQIQWGGVVASTGLASSPQLETTVMPFILRNVTLTGVNSVDAPRRYRERAWELLANHLDRDVLDGLTTTVTLDQVAEAGANLIEGRSHGRTVVTIDA